MEELRKCHFCGGEARVIGAGESYWVRCSGCGAEIAICDSKPEAIAAWNRRVTQNIGKEGGIGMTAPNKSCATCAHSTPSDYGGWVCIHPDLLDMGVVLTVGNNEVCCEWEEEAE